MFQFSYDPDAGTLYLYLTELEVGQVVTTLEYPGHLLLDTAGRIFGLRLDLDDELTLAQLELALDGDFERLDMERGWLTLRIADEQPATLLALTETALLDFAADEVLLGVELALPATLPMPKALERLGPLLVALDDEQPVPEGEGPVVFRMAEADLEQTDQQATLDIAEADLEQTDQQATLDVAQNDQQAAHADEQPAPAVEQEARSAADHPVTVGRSGFVALVGKPNVGKSTLLNALLGQKVAIVSPRPQTTRVPARGILSRPGAQIIFVDTPGIHQPDHALGRLMVDLAEKTLPHADVIGFMVDISQPPSQLDRQIAQQVQRARGAKLLILNKVDQRPRGRQHYLEAYQALGSWQAELAISAQRNMGLGSLLEAIVELLPAGPPLYPEEQVTDQSVQQLAAEFVREKVLYHTAQEVPHAVAVEVEEWEEREQTLFIRMTINVEREGQKAIVIGAGGTMLKKIGSAARYEIERMLGHQVFLELWVKVRPGWRNDVAALGWLGYRARDWS